VEKLTVYCEFMACIVSWMKNRCWPSAPQLREVMSPEVSSDQNSLDNWALPKVVINAGGSSRRVAGILFRNAISRDTMAGYGFTRETGKHHAYRHPEGVRASRRTVVLFTPEAATERRLGT
jgi:hypothetical protein